MKEKLDSILSKGLDTINNTKSLEELEEVRRELTGKKSDLSEVLKGMGSLDADMRKEVGIKVTEIKNSFE